MNPECHAPSSSWGLIAQKAAERDQRSLSSLVEKLLTEYCEEIGLIKPSK